MEEIETKEVLKLLNNMVQIELEAQKTAGGLYIPEGTMSSKDKYLRARVITAGPGSYSSNGKLIPISVKAGDTVIVPGSIPLSTHPYIMDGKTTYIINETSIIGVITEIEI